MIGNALCKQGISTSGYWLGNESMDYSEIESDSGVFFTNPQEEGFKTFLSTFLWDVGYRPDFLVIKGGMGDMWAAASLIMEGVFDFPCISLLNSVTIPFSGFDFMVLDQFSKNLIKNNDEAECYLEVLNKISTLDSSEVVKNIIEKIEMIKEFSLIFDNDTVEEDVENFIEVFNVNVLNKINRGIEISGTVII